MLTPRLGVTCALRCVEARFGEQLRLARERTAAQQNKRQVLDGVGMFYRRRFLGWGVILPARSIL